MCCSLFSAYLIFMNQQGQNFKETEYSASIIIMFACNNT